MNVALIVVGYQCARLVEILSPFIGIRCGLLNDHIAEFEVLPEPSINLSICFVASIFEHSGFETYQNDENARILETYKQSGAIDEFVEVKNKKIKDFESRVIAYNHLKKFSPDYIFQLDCDEFYTREQILNIIDFVRKNEFIDCFKIHFKNYFGDVKDKTYVDFCPLRIIKVNSNGGVDNFIHDNDMIYHNGKKTWEVSTLTIPKNIAWVNHESWCWTDEKSKKRIKNKIFYQQKVLGCCSYIWENETLDINSSYYSYAGLPEIFQD